MDIENSLGFWRFACPRRGLCFSQKRRLFLKHDKQSRFWRFAVSPQALSVSSQKQYVLLLLPRFSGRHKTGQQQHSLCVWNISNRRRQPRQLAGVIGGGASSIQNRASKSRFQGSNSSLFFDSQNDLAWSAKSQLGPGGPTNAIPMFQTACL